MSKDEPILQVNNLFFAYRKNWVLQDVSFSVKKGSITTLLGANGCGKSTLFGVLTQNLTAQKGQALFYDCDISKIDLKTLAHKIAIVHQVNKCSSDITVEELVAYGRLPHRRLFQGHSSEDGQIVDWALSVTGLQRYRSIPVVRLSGGQRQRVWIAMAVAQRTEVLFLDEPTTYLDIKHQIEILKLIETLNRDYGITVVMVLHDINQAVRFSRQIIGMKDGKVLFDGSPKDIIDPSTLRILYDVDLKVEMVAGNQLVIPY